MSTTEAPPPEGTIVTTEATTPQPDAGASSSPGSSEATYSLTLPENAAIDAAVLERTTAQARAWGLSPEHAQQALAFVNQEAAQLAEARAQAALDAHKIGGTEWVKQEAAWREAATADPEIGGEKLSQSATLAKQALTKYGTPTLSEWLESSGLGSHPEVLRLLAKIGKAMSEPKAGEMPLSGGVSAEPPKSAAEVLYGSAAA